MKKLLVIVSLLLASIAASAGITIGAYNIRNFDYDERYRIQTNKPELATMLNSLKADVLSVEEINNTAEFIKFIPANLPGYESALSKCGGAHGQRLGFVYNTKTVNLINFSEDMSVVDPGKSGGCDSGSRPLAIGLFQIKATGQKFYGITVHLKSGSNPESLSKRTKQYEIIKKVISDLKAHSGVKDFYMAGDFNTTEFINKGADYTSFTKLVSDLGALNLSQDLACSAYWWGGTDDGIESPSLLDHIVVSPGLLTKKTSKAQVYGHCKKVSCKAASLADLGISYESVSDHCPMTANIQ